MRMLRASVFVVSALLGACNAGGGGGGGGGDTDASTTPDMTVGNDTGGGNDATMGGDRAPTGDGPSCGAGSANCGACTPLANCGWCRRTNSCVPGSSGGSTTGGCMGADWAYTTSDCNSDGGMTCRSGVPRACNLTLSGAARMCTAGQMVTVGCNQGCGLGTCTGDAVMQICPGNATTPCATAIASNDDAPTTAMCTMRPDGGAADGGADITLCPLVTFMCPADGRYTVWVGAFGTETATCMPAVR